MKNPFGYVIANRKLIKNPAEFLTIKKIVLDSFSGLSYSELSTKYLLSKSKIHRIIRGSLYAHLRKQLKPPKKRVKPPVSKAWAILWMEREVPFFFLNWFPEKGEVFLKGVRREHMRVFAFLFLRGERRISVRKFSHDLRKDPKTIKNSLDFLELTGLIQIERRNKRVRWIFITPGAEKAAKIALKFGVEWDKKERRLFKKEKPTLSEEKFRARWNFMKRHLAQEYGLL